MERSILVKTRNILDGILKFPNLKRGDIGIQIGFDLSSKNLTSDVIVMARRVGSTGKIIAIDPDPFNHDRLKSIMKEYQLPVFPVQRGTYSKPTMEKLVIARRSSWNKLEQFSNVGELTNEARTIEVQLDTVDDIIQELNIPVQQIRHVNITNNGAEFATLQGMRNLLSKTNNLAITLISGRPGVIGEINGRKDVEVVTEFLSEFGFSTRFYWNTQLPWWNIGHRLLMKGKWRIRQKIYGVVMAHKGKARHPWYQSFS